MEQFTTKQEDDKIVLPEVTYSIGKAEVKIDGEWVETPFRVLIETDLKSNHDGLDNIRITQTRL